MIYKIRKRVFPQLDAIYFYILENEYQSRAEKVMKSIFDAFDNLTTSPQIYPKHPNFINIKSDTRKTIVHKTYIITFRIFKNHVAILDVYHGKRKPF